MTERFFSERFFQRNLAAAKTLRKIRYKSDFFHGYMVGLTQRHHGESHEDPMPAENDAEQRKSFVLGYRVGFQGRPVKEILETRKSLKRVLPAE